MKFASLVGTKSAISPSVNYSSNTKNSVNKRSLDLVNCSRSSLQVSSLESELFLTTFSKFGWTTYEMKVVTF